MANKKQAKRGPGRPPKQKVFSAAELHAKAEASIERSRARHRDSLPEKAEELLIKTQELNQYKRMTLKEIEELRKQVSEVYNEFKAQQDEAEAQANSEMNKLVAVLTAQVRSGGLSKTLTEAEWHELHGRRPDGSKPRGPKPKRKKLVWEIPAGEMGTASEPPEPIDIEGMERVFEQALMEQHLQQQKEESKFIKGKRLRNDTPVKRSKTDDARFYY